MIFETHAHYEDSRFDEDRDALIRSLPESGIAFVTNVGSSLATCEETARLVETYDFFYGAIGVHPSELGDLNEETFPRIRELLARPKMVAVGEIGLDYHYDDTDPGDQKKWFLRQIDLARELSLPMIIHSRDAARDTLDIMKAEHTEEIGGVIHCFSYSVEIAREYLNMGFYLGVDGPVTFKNSKKTKEVVAYAPLDRLVLETDSPYMAPEPNRGKRNSSLNLPYIAEEVARIKGITRREVEKATFENAKRLFGIKE